MGDPSNQRIRVVETRGEGALGAALALSAASAEEVAAAGAAAAAAAPPALRGLLGARGLLDLSAPLRGPLAPLLALSPGAPPPPLPALPAVALRALLLADPSVRLVLAPGRGAPAPLRAAAGALAGPLLVRPAARARALSARGRPAAVAAEEAAAVVALAVGGGADLRGGFPAPVLGLPARAASGVFTGPLLGAEGGPPFPWAPGPPPAEAAGLRLPRGLALTPLGDVPRLWARALAAAAFVFGPGARPAAARALAAAAPFAPERAFAPPGGGPPGPTWRAAAWWREALAAFVREAAAAGAPPAPAPSGPSAPSAPSGPSAPAPEAAPDLLPLWELVQEGAAGVLLFALVAGSGEASPAEAAAAEGRVAAFLEGRAILRARAAQLGAAAARLRAAAARAQLLLRVVEDKLGAATAAAVEAAAPGGGPRGVLRALAALPGAGGAAAARMVEAEYADQVATWRAEAANPCPHVRLALRLRRAASAEEAAEALAGLRRFLPQARDAPRGRPGPPGGRPGGRPGRGAPAPPAALEWLSCGACGLRALCPHVLERAELEAAGAPPGDVAARLQGFAARALQREAAASFCRVCGEQLGGVPGPDDVAPPASRFGELDAPLRGRVWGLAVRAAERARFPVPVDPRLFAGAATDAVFPLVAAAAGAGGPIGTKGEGRRGGPRRRGGPAAGARGPGAGAGARGPGAGGEGGDPEEEGVAPAALVTGAVFVYAYLLEQVRAAQAARGPPVGFEGVRPGARLSAYAEQMLLRLAEDLRPAIAQIEGFSAEALKDRFVDAFRALQGAALPPAAAPEEELARFVVADPVFQFAAAAARFAGALPPGRPATPAAAAAEFEAVMGARLPDLARRARAAGPAAAVLRGGFPPGADPPFAAKDPRVNLFAGLFALEPEGKAGPDRPEGKRGGRAPDRRRDGRGRDGRSRDGRSRDEPGRGEQSRGERSRDGQSRDGKSRDEQRRDGKSRDEQRRDGQSRDGQSRDGKSRDGQSRDGQSRDGKSRDEQRRGERPRERRWHRPPPPREGGAGHFREAYRLFREYTLATSRAELDGVLARVAEARRREPPRPGIAAVAVHTLDHDDRQRHADTRVPLGAIFDEEGRRHDWERRASFVFRLPGGGESVVPNKGGGGVAEARREGLLPFAAVLVDVECGGCGVRASRAGALSGARIAAALRMRSEADAFFAFFASRCPEGERHSWVAASPPAGAPAGGGASRCARCGLGSAPGGGGRPEGAAAFYERYAETWRRERAAAKAAEEAAGAPAPGPAPGGPPGGPPPPPLAPWVPDFTRVVRAAALAETTPAALEALACAEGREWADVVEGRGAPPPPASPEDPRVFAADAEVRSFLSDFNRLLTAARGGHPPPEALADVPRHEWGRLPELLPDVGRDYLAARAEVRAARPAEIFAFTVQSLCEMALRIAGAGEAPGAPPWLGPLGRRVAREGLEKVLRGQRLMSKPGPLDWGLFSAAPPGDDDADGEEDGDVAGDVGEDVALEQEAAAATGDDADLPFSSEHIDLGAMEDDDSGANLEPND